MRPAYKDPSQQLLEAYQTLLGGSITLDGEEVTVGTRIPRKKLNYVHLYIEAINNYDTGDKVLYNVTVALEIVSVQEISEGNEEVANDIQNQVLQLIDDPADLAMTDFTCLTCQFGDSEHNTEMTDANYIITRKLRINHFIEQN